MAHGRKHLLIHVPDHDSIPDAASSTGVETYSTFLRIGSPDLNPPMKALLEEIVTEGFIDDTRDRGQNHAVTQATVEGAGGDAGPGHELTVTQRQNETSRFLKKGGWHDHTQGNRISTTFGDRVDVVRGNYKLVVLGRQDELDEAASSDMSGGLRQDADLSPGSITEIKWVKDPYEGTWKVTELTEKGNFHEIFHGDKVEEIYGNKIETTIGSESQGDLPATELTPKRKMTRPAITERTWATTIDTKTVANSVKDEVRATNVENRVKGPAYIKEYIGDGGDQVKEVDEQTFADFHKSMTVANSAVNLEFLGTETHILIAGVMADIEVSTLRLEVKAGVGFLEIEAGALYTEIFMGVKAEFSLARKVKFDTGVYTTNTDSAHILATDTKLVAMQKRLSAVWKATTFAASIGLGAD